MHENKPSAQKRIKSAQKRRKAGKSRGGGRGGQMFKNWDSTHENLMSFSPESSGGLTMLGVARTVAGAGQLLPQKALT